MTTPSPPLSMRRDALNRSSTGATTVSRAPRTQLSVPAPAHGLSHSAIRQLIMPIQSHSPLHQSLLEGELERFYQSLRWIPKRNRGVLLDVGGRGDLVPVYQSILGFDEIYCIDAGLQTGQHTLQHEDGSHFHYFGHRANLETDPYPIADESVDQVVAMEILEHLAVDPMFMLSECNRVLQPGGSLLLTTPNIISFSCLYHLVWGRHPALGRQAFGPGIMDRHHREYTPGEVVEAMEAAGFVVEQMDTFNSTEVGAAVRKVRRLLNCLKCIRPSIDVSLRSNVIRCRCTKRSGVVERFPHTLYPRYRFYDYEAYEDELASRFGGQRYWRSEVAQKSAHSPAFLNRVQAHSTKR